MSTVLDRLPPSTTLWLSSKWTLVAAAAVLVGLRSMLGRKKLKGPLPPGPRGIPIFGNALQIPLKEGWRTYIEWSKKYGDVIYLDSLGQGIVVLNSFDAIQELLVKRAANYSDRIESAVDEIMEIDWSFPLMRYGPRWRDHRRAFHQFFHQGQVAQWRPLLEDEMLTYLRRLQSSPKDFLHHNRLLFGTILLRISYGFEQGERTTRLLYTVDYFLRNFFEFASPGRLLVTSFPRMKYIPSWLPGAGWKRNLEKVGAIGTADVLQGPFDETVSRLKSGYNDRYPSLVRSLTEALPEESDPAYRYQETVARNVSAISYVAGSDTTMSTGAAILLALAMHPEVQKKAQAEVDAHVGTGRLPTCQDTEEMPYLQAIVKEIGRWHTVLPLSLPHATMEDDFYNGYFIPAGTWILPNSWAIMHDPAVFDRPLEFIPERYLKDGQIDPSVPDADSGSFGYGRRICPGRHLANETMALFLASVLAVFDVKAPLDENGKPKPMSLKTDSLMLTTPLPFECDIVPRSAEHADLLR